MARRNGAPVAEMGDAQMKMPELPPDLRWRQSASKMKFSYMRGVRSAPIGLPVQVIMPSFTPHVLGAQLTLTQSERSLPLKRAVKPSSSAAEARVAARNRARTRSRKDFMNLHGS